MNLSWNEGVFRLTKQQKRIKDKAAEKKLKLPTDGDQTDDEEMSPVESEIMLNLCTFIKHNPKLLHLDLSHMGLPTAMLKELGPALRKAKSLVSLHISGNPGGTKKLKRFLHSRAKCTPKVKSVYIDHLDRGVDNGFGGGAHAAQAGGFVGKNGKEYMFKAG